MINTQDKPFKTMRDAVDAVLERYPNAPGVWDDQRRAIWKNPEDHRSFREVGASWSIHASVYIDDKATEKIHKAKAKAKEQKAEIQKKAEEKAAKQRTGMGMSSAQKAASFAKALFKITTEKDSTSGRALMRDRLKVCSTRCEPVGTDASYFVPDALYRWFVRVFFRIINGSQAGHCRICSCQLSAKRVFWNKLYHKEDSCPHPDGSRWKSNGV